MIRNNIIINEITKKSEKTKVFRNKTNKQKTIRTKTI